MSHYTVSYRGDNSGRKAINDLIGWFGLNKSKLIIRGMRACKTFSDIDGVDMAIGFGGVTGEPVRRLISYCFGEEVLQAWSKAKRGDKTLIKP